MSREPALFVCARVSDPLRRVIEGAQIRVCATCGEKVYVTPGTLAREEMKDPRSVINCTHCADLEGMTIAPPTEQQKAELRASGHDPEQWPLKDAWGQKVTRSN